MLKSTLYGIMNGIVWVRNWVVALCGRFLPELTDRQLYLVTAGIAGLGIFLLVHPIIRRLARRGNEVVISWVYTLTLLVALMLGGQISLLMTETGTMHGADILFCMAGFLAVLLVYCLYCGIRKCVNLLRRKTRR